MTSDSGSRNTRQRDAANDRGPAKSSDTSGFDQISQKLAVDGNYYFEICCSRPQYKSMPPENSAIWSWRLLSPAGATMIECGGYADLDSCRAAVDLLKEKAGSALVSDWNPQDR